MRGMLGRRKDVTDMQKAWALLLVLAALAGGLLCGLKKLQDRRRKPLVETFHHR